MNVRYDEDLNGCVLPDPWTKGAEPSSDELLPFYRFVKKNVQEHTRDDLGLGLSDYLQFLRFMLSHGLSASTGVAIARQLLRERSGKYRWKRAVLLDRLQWDAFCWYYTRTRPQFSTFFLNSTAHLQHLFWRNMDPSLFTVKPTAEEQDELASAVQFGYEQMDRIVGQVLKLAGDDVTLMLCTALSQQPCLKYEDSGGKVFYRATNIQELLSFAGFDSPYEYYPVMAEEFHLRFQTQDAAADAERKLGALRVDGRPAMRGRLEEDGYFGGCGVFHKLPEDSLIELGSSGRTIPFFDIFWLS